MITKIARKLIIDLYSDKTPTAEQLKAQRAAYMSLLKNKGILDSYDSVVSTNKLKNPAFFIRPDGNIGISTTDNAGPNISYALKDSKFEPLEMPDTTLKQLRKERWELYR